MRPVVVCAGIGVDSSSVLALLAGGDPRLAGQRSRLAAVATSDLETEDPTTYVFRDHYLRPFLQERGMELVVVSPAVRDRHGQVHSNLYDYYFAQGMVPSRARRSCTNRFKIARVKQYIREQVGPEAEVIIGFDCQEATRAAKLRNTAAFTYSCPMMDLGMDRLDACATLLRFGLPVPRRSACFCCPFAKSDDWAALSRQQPARYQQCVDMEEEVRRVRGRELLLGRKPLRDYPQPRVYRVPAEPQRLFARAQSLLGQITPAWPSQALCLAAQELYGADWPVAVRAFKIGPKPLLDPWQLYLRLEHCLERGTPLPVAATRPCGAVELSRPVDLPSSGVASLVL